jgi:hypothetical protein
VIFKECKTKECQNKIAMATMERKRKRGKPCQSWRDEVEEGLLMTGIRKEEGDG